MASQALFAAQVGMGALRAYQSYQADIQDGQNQLLNIELQREANELRHRQSLRSLRRKAKAFQARQKGAFISSGVKLEGSATTAIGDALANELEATLALEKDFEVQQTSLMLAEADTRSAMDQAAMNRFMEFAGGALSTGASYARNR